MKHKFKILLAILLISSNMFVGDSHIQLLGGISQIEDRDSTFVFGTGIDLIKTFYSWFEVGGR